MKTFLTHVLYLVANPKAASSHVDAVYSRKCVNFILHSVLGKMLSEKAQVSACKEILQIVIKEMNSMGMFRNIVILYSLIVHYLFCRF